jgi:hypothetical protein
VIQPKERPILFSGPMVRAILEGRKTQTRRVVKFRPQEFVDEIDAGKEVFWTDQYGDFHTKPCPYGKPGDRLWVRENFFFDNPDYVQQYKENPWMGTPDRNNADVRYQANEKHPDMFRWKPSIHMPRRASRLTLEITNVRVERLNEISESDCLAEGCSGFDPEPKDQGGTCFVRKGISSAPHPQTHFRMLWESINGAGSWAANSWVWVVEFKKL